MKIDPADKWFSLWIRNRDNWTCQRCFAKHEPPTSALHCSHFFGRRKESTRYEPLNCVALCMGCHLYFTSHPAEHYEWQVKRLGQDVIDKLTLQANTPKKKDRKIEAMYWQQQVKELHG